MGLREGFPPHFKDVMDILHQVWEEIPPQKIKNCWNKSTLVSFDPPTNNDDVVVVEYGDTTGADIGGNGDDNELVEDNADDDVDAEGVVNDTVVTYDEEVGDEESKKIYELAAYFTKKNHLNHVLLVIHQMNLKMLLGR